MISIDVDNVPAFLRSGSFYESLDMSEQHAPIQVPESCYVENDEVNNIADLAKLINVVAFWALHSMPMTMIVFCDQTEPSVWRDVFTEYEELDFAKALLDIFESNKPLEKAIELGTTEVVDYLARICTDDTASCVKAAELGRNDYLSILIGHLWDETVSEKAAQNGYLHCLKYLHENGYPWNKRLHIVGKPSCVQYACEQGLELDDNITELVAASGHADTLKYFIDHGNTIDEKTLTSAAQHGNVACLIYLLEINCPVSENTIDAAAEFGHLECIQLLHQHFDTTLWTARTSCLAACGGLECLQYLHENGCPWDERTTSCAAGRGRLDCLRYAFDNGGLYYEDIIARAVGGINSSSTPNMLQCLQYLHEEHNIPFTDDGAEIIEVVCWGNHYVLQYMIDQGCPYLSCQFDHEDLFVMTILFSTQMQDDSVHRYDCNLVKCIECLLDNKYDMFNYGKGLIYFVIHFADKVPWSHEYLAKYGFV